MPLSMSSAASAARRTIVALVAWAVGAALSVSIGLLALSKISDRLDSGAARQPVPWTAPVPSRSPTGTPWSPAPRSATPAAAPVQRGDASPTHTPTADQVVSSTGGSAVVRCGSDGAYLVSWSPQPGYSIGPVSRGPETVAQVVFESAGGTIRLAVRCVGGVAQPVRPPVGGPVPPPSGAQSYWPPPGGRPGGGPSGGFGPTR